MSTILPVMAELQPHPAPIYVLGTGAIGFPLAAYLATTGRPVLAVRTSRNDIAHTTITVRVQHGEHTLSTAVETISLAQLPRLDGLLVITSKSYANPVIAQALRAKAATGPVVILQNGIGVEQPFSDAGCGPIYRGVLYVTSQALGEYAFRLRPISPSPIGSISGTPTELAACVTALTTTQLPFRAEADIQPAIWQKAIINAVFNTICPLLDVDNGIFARDTAIAQLAHAVVHECVLLTDRLRIGVNERAIMEQLLLISQQSAGQQISTLQDIQHGRPTEIAALNQAIVQIGAALQPPLALPRTEALGQLVAAKAEQQAARMQAASLRFCQSPVCDLERPSRTCDREPASGQ